MAWIATDEDGQIVLFTNEPVRQSRKETQTGIMDGYWTRVPRDDGRWCFIGEKQSHFLIGKVLTWEDEPVELK